MLTLRAEQIEALKQVALKKSIKDFAVNLKEDFSKELAAQSIDEIYAQIYPIVERMMGYGFTKKAYLYKLAAWGLFYGEGYEEHMAGGDLFTICNSKCAEEDKFSRFCIRIESEPQEPT